MRHVSLLIVYHCPVFPLIVSGSCSDDLFFKRITRFAALSRHIACPVKRNVTVSWSYGRHPYSLPYSPWLVMWSRKTFRIFYVDAWSPWCVFYWVWFSVQDLKTRTRICSTVVEKNVQCAFSRMIVMYLAFYHCNSIESSLSDHLPWHKRNTISRWYRHWHAEDWQRRLHR